MNVPKRRGRPPKGRIDRIEPASDSPLSNMVGHWSVERQAAQEFALRVWEGQSRDLPRRVRIERVKSALDKQNLPFEGVQLP